ncbi:MAG: hypothetical protein U9O98_06230 [Asgard group archaeon]|nr:hypothetical protein [Asgard group archaeon]
MKKNVFIKTAIPLIIAIIMIGGNVSYSQQKAQAVPKTVVATTSHTYEVNGYLEAIDIYPLKGTAVGINTGFIGGSVELPFDITSYNTLELFTLTVANQRAWRQYSQRRFWDTPDGITMMLVFKNSDQDAALEDAEEIEAMIESVYDMNLALVAGEREAASRKTTIIFQGSMSIEAFANYTSEFCDYVSDEGLGKAVDETLLDDAPVKAMSIGLLNGDFNLEGIIDISGWIPVINAAWIDPNGLEQTGTQITMSVDNILPTLGTVEGADNSIASFVTMNLPYVVDLQSCEPETDNDYPQYARRFEWILKVDIPLINWTLDRHYDDIEVVYDLNITDLIHYPQVIGTMEITNELPLEGNEDLTYEFTFENVGDETAYDITMAYGEFANANLGGFNFTVNNPELVFDENQLMYYDNDTGILSTDPTGAELTIDGWFKWISNSSWLKDGDVVSEEFFDVELGEIIYTTTTALTIDSGDFDLVPIMENDTPTNTSRLETTINEIAPGDNVTVSFTIENLPGGVFNVYNAIKVGNTIDLYIEESFAIEDILIEMFKLSGSTLHIPEDQKTWANWFPQPVSGSAFTYVDA